MVWLLLPHNSLGMMVMSNQGLNIQDGRASFRPLYRQCPRRYSRLLQVHLTRLLRLLFLLRLARAAPWRLELNPRIEYC